MGIAHLLALQQPIVFRHPSRSAGAEPGWALDSRDQCPAWVRWAVRLTAPVDLLPPNQ